jgi:hypothetical protein
VADWVRFYAPPILAWMFVVGRLAGPYRVGTPERLTILVILAGVASTVTLTTPFGYSVVTDLTGVPNLARLLGHASMLIVVWAAIRLMVNLSHPGPRWDSRWPTWWMLGTLAAMTVSFLLADTPRDDARFAVRYAAVPGVLEYWLIFISYLVPIYAVLCYLAHRYARLTTRRSLRVGLRLVITGIILSAVYHVHKAVLFAAARFRFDYPVEAVREFLDRHVVTVSMVLVFVGLILPSWIPRALTWLRYYRTYHRLRLLWLSLHRASPQIALEAPTSGLQELLVPRDLSLRLYRRVIEIRDGRLALAQYLDPSVAARAEAEAREAGLTGQKAEAAVEATTLAAALDAKRTGRRPTNPMPATAISGGADITADTAFLEEVARAFRRLNRDHSGTEPDQSEMSSR